MEIQVLGAHNAESESTRMASLLVDGVLALDAGGLTGSLSFAAQQQLQAILLTHYHYDHVRDVPALAMNALLRETSINLYATRAVRDVLAAHLMNGQLYPDFMVRPPEKPAISFNPVVPGQAFRVGEMGVLPVAVNHAVTALGYEVTDSAGAAMFYTGDTGPGLAECWRQVTPRLLIIEVTAPNRFEDFAREAGHLTPGLLATELASFREVRGYLPQVVAIHLNPGLETEIAAELDAVAASLDCPITRGHEGMRLQL